MQWRQPKGHADALSRRSVLRMGFCCRRYAVPGRGGSNTKHSRGRVSWESVGPPPPDGRLTFGRLMPPPPPPAALATLSAAFDASAFTRSTGSDWNSCTCSKLEHAQHGEKWLCPTFHASDQ